MKNISIQELVFVHGSSAGAQPKYYNPTTNEWYKQNIAGCEGIAESMVSKLLPILIYPIMLLIHHVRFKTNQDVYPIIFYKRMSH